MRKELGSYPKVLSVEPGNIDPALQAVERWIPWRAGPIKPNGKFDKIPTDGRTGRKMDPHDESNWLTFDEAVRFHTEGRASGIGIVLSDRHPIAFSDKEYFLIAIDLDNVKTKSNEARELWLRLGKPYLEVSPSGRGLRMLCLSSEPAHVGNVGDGRELYSRSQFVTITGCRSRGSLRDCTAPLREVEAEWQKEKARKSAPEKVTRALSQPKLLETTENVAAVQGMLDRISSDISYDDYRNIVWAAASLGWQCIPSMLHEWSKKAPHRYDADVLDKLIRSFEPGRGITLGTLVHHARLNGWTGTLPATMSQVTNQSPEVDQRTQKQPCTLYTAQDLKALPVLPDRVRGLLPARGVGAVFGSPSSGKTFLCVDLAVSVAEGREDWFGHKVKQAPVVYVALEGRGGIPKRIIAAEKHQKKPLTDQMRVAFGGVNLLTGEGVDDLVAAAVSTLGSGIVVFIDTLNQSAPGGDENTSETMGAIIANAQKLANAVDGLVILVHHSGKEQSRGLRGHSSLLAAMDTVIEVRADQGGRQWCVTKSKDDGAGHTRSFELVAYEVGHDEDGSPITSCAVKAVTDLLPSALPPPSGKNQRAALAEIKRVCQASEGPLTYKDAIAKVAAVLTGNRARERAREAIDTLRTAGHLKQDEGGTISPN